MKISAVGAPAKPVYGNLPNKPAFGGYGTFTANNYKPDGGSSSLPNGGMLRPPIPGFPGSGGSGGSGGAGGNYAANYSGYQQPPWLKQYANTQSASYGKPQTYNAVDVPQWTPDKTDYVGQAYQQVSNTGGLQGLYDNIYKNTQRLDPYGSGLSSEAATQAMMNTAMGFVMPYAGQLSGQGFQGGMQNVQNQYGANINAQNLTAGSYNNAMQNYAQQQANLANLAQQQYQWGQGFGFNQAQADQAQANWQAQFDRQNDWYKDAQKSSNRPTAGGGTQFYGSVPWGSNYLQNPLGVNPGGAGTSVAGSTNPTWGSSVGSGWGIGYAPQSNDFSGLGWSSPNQVNGEAFSWGNTGGGVGIGIGGGW